MAALDALPPDQRAVLQLVLRQGRSLDDLAGLLSISPDAVRDRARIGAEALAPPAPVGLDAAERGRIALWLLGQDGDEPPAVLEGSEPARRWARGLRDALAPLARDELPAVPAAGPSPSPAGDPERARRAPHPPPRSSRLGGALLLGGLGIALVALVVWLVADRGGDNDSSAASRSPGASATSTQAGSSAGAIRTVARVSLTPPKGDGSKARGLAQLAVRGTAAAFVVAAEGLTPRTKTYFGFWVVGGSQKPGFLGAIQNSGLRQGGQLAAQARVPKAIASYTTFVVTREPVTGSRRAPAQPGPILLAGPLRITGRVGG
jgi:hypothetical protein